LTFSCYRRYPFLGRERTRGWFREALEDWEWCSARWYCGEPRVKIEMDDTIKTELARDGLLDLVARRREPGEIKC
jgi:hypothetical protein